MIHRVSMMSLTGKTEPAAGCGSHDFPIRVLYLDLFCTSNTAIWNRKYMLSCFIPGNNFENNK